MEADPRNPSRVVGFEVDIAELLARGLGRTPRFVQVGFITLDAAAARGDFDIGLSGIEDTRGAAQPARRHGALLRVPRGADGARGRRGRAFARWPTWPAGASPRWAPRWRSTSCSRPDRHGRRGRALRGRRASLQRPGARPRGRGGAGRGAGRAGRPPQSRARQSAVASVGVGHYVGILAPEATALRDQIDAVLKQAMRDGRLEAIFRKWRHVERRPAAPLRARARGLGDRTGHDGAAAGRDGRVRVGVGGDAAVPAVAARARPSPRCCSRACRWRSPWSSACCWPPDASTGRDRWAWRSPAWVELIRGTPLLLQLFVLYFGLAVVVQLPAVVAAVLGAGAELRRLRERDLPRRARTPSRRGSSTRRGRWA